MPWPGACQGRLAGYRHAALSEARRFWKPIHLLGIEWLGLGKVGPPVIPGAVRRGGVRARLRAVARRHAVRAARACGNRVRMACDPGVNRSFRRRFRYRGHQAGLQRCSEPEHGDKQPDKPPRGGSGPECVTASCHVDSPFLRLQCRTCHLLTGQAPIESVYVH